jgi:hypothetical protein
VPTIPEYEVLLREQLEAMGPAQRAELLHTLELTDFQRAERIGELWWSPATRSLAELLIDAEENRYVRAPLVPMLRERQHRAWRT